MTRYIAYSLLALVLTGPVSCTVKPPVVAPPVATMSVHVQVNAAETGAGLTGAAVSIQTAPETWLGASTDSEGHLVFTVPASLVNSHLRVSLAGRMSYDQSVLVSRDATLTVSLRRIVPPLPRVRIEGRVFRLADGSRFAWRGLTAFKLPKVLADGQEASAVALLDWAKQHGVTVVRVLTTAVHLFDLAPESGRAALPKLLELAAARGIYVEAVAIADSADRAYDLEAHVRGVGQACAASPACLGVEIANEPAHPTQLAWLADPAYLLRLRALVPSSVLVALGAAHGSDDESDAYNGGDYITTHADRADGEGGWRAVRHAKDSVRDKSDRARKPVVDDEPAKDLDVEHWRVKGLLARVLPAPGTFHYQDGLQGRVPTGEALAAFQAWQEGLAALPADLEETSQFQNAGWTYSPVEAADWTKVVRVYSALGTGWAYSVLVGLNGDPALELPNGWRVSAKNGVLWKLERR